MNVTGLIISVAVLVLVMKPAYEIWFQAERYRAGINVRREATQKFLACR